MHRGSDGEAPGLVSFVVERLVEVPSPSMQRSLVEPAGDLALHCLAHRATLGDRVARGLADPSRWNAEERRADLARNLDMADEFIELLRGR